MNTYACLEAREMRDVNFLNTTFIEMLRMYFFFYFLFIIIIFLFWILCHAFIIIIIFFGYVTTYASFYGAYVLKTMSRM